ncbi:hypothetical protein M2480_000957 [Parabacteroides sp. PFB2-12]|uniref:hypothetical protein n=1 Tax=unclassified Parabacteroides TaxID=2649774 RepID=UPI0024732ED5|nr:MULTISPECIES: hypothetical protein [unclassified Parabacteroides]MDH6341586.1 hypothetical protein [Parabacteroides sp. PM6-13]MDH6389991.1 hypothetical protein [Parabacteroides sp. PFB2-12]
MRTTHFLILGMIIMLVTSCGSSKQSSSQELNNSLSRKEVLRKEAQRKAIKQARKDAKTYENEGFKTFIGGLPLEKQIENAWLKAIDIDNAGYPEYIVANARVIGGNTTAAKAQAMHMAKVELASLISSNIAVLIEGSTANNELSQEEAVSLNEVLQASKELITGELGRVLKELEVYRELPNKNCEVMICLSYSTQLALEAAKQSMVRKMGEGTESLHKKLDKMLDLDKFDPNLNTNLIMDVD